MKPDDERLPVVDVAAERRRRARDGAMRRRLADRLVPGLPVDADAAELRIPEVRVGWAKGMAPESYQQSMTSFTRCMSPPHWGQRITTLSM